MDSLAVEPLAPSAQPALELIALAQLPAEEARLRLRALLLANPNHFGNVPLASFNAVLNIHQDTTYESISGLGYNSQRHELRTHLNLRQSKGYSSKGVSSGSREYIRFYVSVDGGTSWLDQGMKSVSVFDALWPGNVSFEVTQQVICGEQLRSMAAPLRIRAVLSWNAEPPAQSPAWIPNWGNVLESEPAMEDQGCAFSSATDTAVVPCGERDRRKEPTGQQIQSFDHSSRGHVQLHSPQSSKVDPEHRFFAYLLAKAAGTFTFGVCGSHFNSRGEPRRSRA
jgi:hypothetical protein